MKKVVLFALFLAFAVGICFFLHNTHTNKGNVPNDNVSKEYLQNIKVLEDTIKNLKEVIKGYEEEVSRINDERESIKSNIRVILSDNEKIDNVLANGDWDYNIRFLSEFLSQEDSVPRGHGIGDNQAAVGEDKQVYQ